MPDYRLYHFDRGHIQRAEDISAEDDVDAVRAAEQRVDGKMAELWLGNRMLKTFNPPAGT